MNQKRSRTLSDTLIFVKKLFLYFPLSLLINLVKGSCKPQRWNFWQSKNDFFLPKGNIIQLVYVILSNHSFCIPAIGITENRVIQAIPCGILHFHSIKITAVPAQSLLNDLGNAKEFTFSVTAEQMSEWH